MVEIREIRETKLLVIEDDLAHFRLIQRALENAQGSFLLVHARNLLEAKSLLDSRNFDLILADIILPDGIGTDIMQEIPHEKYLPVLIITSHGSEEIAVQVLKSGALDYIVKSEESYKKLPFTIERSLREWEHIRIQKRTEKALIESEKKYRYMFEFANDAVFIIDPQTYHFIDVNRKATEKLGYSRTEMLSMSLQDISPVTGEDSCICRFASLANQPELVFECDYLCNNKTWLPFEISARLIDFEDTSLILAFSRDISARKQAERKLEEHLARIEALQEISNAILEKHDLKEILDVCLDETRKILHVEAGEVMLCHADSEKLSLIYDFGFWVSSEYFKNIGDKENCASDVIRSKELIYIHNLNIHHKLNGNLPNSWKDEKFYSYVGVPLISKGDVIGVLELFTRREIFPSSDWFSTLEKLAAQIAIAIDESLMFNALQQSHQDLSFAYDFTLEGWARALELRDKETEGHSRRVTELTLILAECMNISSEELVHIRRGSILHDIGKMGVPDSILLKPGPLSEDEWEIMGRHPVYAYELLSPIDYLQPALDIPYCHHERWDGSGYPRKLKGEQIPLAARIFSVVDVWDALLSSRPYRPAWPIEKVLAYIEEQSGKQFDPEVVRVFLDLQHVTDNIFGGVKETYKKIILY